MYGRDRQIIGSQWQDGGAEIQNRTFRCCISKFFLYCLLFFFGLVAIPALAADKPPARKLALDLSLYPYLDRVKNDTDLTVLVNAKLPARFSYFGFMNLRGVITDGDVVFNRSEQNLRWGLSENLPIDINFQALLIDGGANDFSQIGFSWRVSDTGFLKGVFERLNLSYRMNVYLKRFSFADDDAWQMEHFFRLTFPGISERLYLIGFLDQTFNIDLPAAFPRRPIVSEVQLGARIFDRFYAVTEYRINEFRISEKYNLAIGIEYKFRW